MRFVVIFTIVYVLFSWRMSYGISVNFETIQTCKISAERLLNGINNLTAGQLIEMDIGRKQMPMYFVGTEIANDKSETHIFVNLEDKVFVRIPGSHTIVTNKDNTVFVSQKNKYLKIDRQKGNTCGANATRNCWMYFNYLVNGITHFQTDLLTNKLNLAIDLLNTKQRSLEETQAAVFQNTGYWVQQINATEPGAIDKVIDHLINQKGPVQISYPHEYQHVTDQESKLENKSYMAGKIREFRTSLPTLKPAEIYHSVVAFGAIKLENEVKILIVDSAGGNLEIWNISDLLIPNQETPITFSIPIMGTPPSATADLLSDATRLNQSENKNAKWVIDNIELLEPIDRVKVADYIGKEILVHTRAIANSNQNRIRILRLHQYEASTNSYLFLNEASEQLTIKETWIRNFFSISTVLF